MFAAGQQVIYGIHGVCQILGTEVRSVDRKNVEYYALSPISQPESRFYVPVHNPAAVKKLRPVLSRTELDALLQSPEVTQDAWIPDENQRKQRYRELISSSDRTALLCMVRTLLKQKAQRLAEGKKFHLCDDNFLRDAQRLLSTEFSLVLQIPSDQVGAYIENAIK